MSHRERLLIDPVIFAAAAMRRLTVADRVLICLAPVPEANRGDQALTIAAVEELRRRGLTDLTLIATSQHPIETYTAGAGLRIVSDLHLVFQTDRCLGERLRWIRLLTRAQALVLIGADVLDEGYGVERSAASLWAVRTANRLGVPARIVGFSVNGPPSPQLRKSLASLGNTQLRARDPASFRRLQEAGVPHVQLAGDLAFLLQPAEWSDVPGYAREFLTLHAGKVVGLNFTDVIFGPSPEAMFRRIAEAMAVLAEEDGLRFLLIPHDDQGGVEYLRRLLATVEAVRPGMARMVDPLPSVRQLKAIAGRCRHVFTCRLHLGIATWGMGRPITCFPYQGKFEGQFEHLGLSDDGLISPESLPDDPRRFADVIRDRLNQSELIVAQLERRLPAIRELALNNFDGLGDLPLENEAAILAQPTPTRDGA